MPTAADAAASPSPGDATSTPAGAAASTLAELDDVLLGGPRTLTLRDLAERIDAPLDFVRLYWQTLGLPHPEADDEVFTEQDAAAVGRVSRMIRERGLALRTASSLTRALGHTADRLALWQVEALVEDMATRYGLDDTSARLLVLDQLADLAPLLEAQLVHA
ncbi:MAG TPA: adenylate/guanylate cyclase domain-containing protein, partial [Cellulomonas sp.]